MNIQADESIISVTLTLFMLSLITEKISNFIKLNLPSLYMKFDAPDEEKKRERKIQLLTGLIGIMVALLCNADFFTLIKQNGNIAPLSQLTLAGSIGCIITGLFLSQGSKFFHDLLDTVLYYKNVKKSLFSKQEIVNDQLRSKANLTADDLVHVVTADQRQDDEDINH